MANRTVDARHGGLSGTLPVLATPFTAEGAAVDRASLRRLVDYAVDAGADGLVYPGVASEFGQLTVEERTAALETVVDAARGRLPVIVGASADDPPGGCSSRLPRPARGRDRCHGHGAAGPRTRPRTP